MSLSDIQLQFVQRYLTKQLPVPIKVGPTLVQVAKVGETPTDPPTFEKKDIEGFLLSVAAFRKSVENLLGAPHSGLTGMADKVQKGFEDAANIDEDSQFQTAVTQADKALDAAFEELGRQSEARKAYLAELPQAESLRTALKAHPKFSAVESGKAQAVEDALGQAKTDATQMDFPKALESLKEFDTKRRSARDDADAAARFDVVLQARKDDVLLLDTELGKINWQGWAIPPALTTLHDDAKKLVSDAETEGCPGGLTKLDQFPAAAREVRTQMGKAQHWLTNRQWIDDFIAEIEPARPPYIAESEVNWLKTQFQLADNEASASNYGKACDLLTGFEGQANALWKRKADYDRCKTELDHLKGLEANWTGLAGSEPADTYLAKFGTLRGQAETKLGVHDFSACTARLKAMRDLASSLQMLGTGIADAKGKITAQKTPPESVYLAGTFIRAEEIMAEAEREKLAGNATRAQTLCEEAEALMKGLVDDDKDAVDYLDNEVTAIKGLTADMDNDGAQAVADLLTQINAWEPFLPENFTTAYGGTCDYDSDALQEAMDLHGEADTALNTPDMPEAKTKIEEALDALERGIKQSRAASSYVNYKTAVVEKQEKVTRITENETDYDDADTDITDSQTAAHAHDYATAATKLKDAETKLARAAKVSTANDGYDKATGANGYGGIDATCCDMTLISTEYAALTTKVSDINDAWNMNDVDRALQLQKELLRESHQVFVVGAEAKARTRVGEVRALMTGKSWSDKLQPIEDALVKIEARITAAVDKKDRGLEEAASWDIYGLFPEIDALETRATATNAFETDKAGVDTKVKALDTPLGEVKPNAAAETLVQGIKDKFQDAVQDAGAGDYVPADKLLKETGTAADAAGLTLAGIKAAGGRYALARSRFDGIGPTRAGEIQLDTAFGHLEAARFALDAGKTVEADDATTKANAQLDEAERLITQNGLIAGDAEAAGKLATAEAEVNADDLRPLIEKAENGLSRVQGRLATVPGQVRHVKAIEAKLKLAKGDPSKEAAAALQDCLTFIANADADADQHAAFVIRRKAVADQMPGVETVDKGGAWVKDHELAMVTNVLSLADDDAASNMFSSALGQVRSAQEEVDTARTAAEAFKAYQDKLAGSTKTAVDDVKTHDHRFAVTSEIDEIDSLLTEAAGQITGRDAVAAVRTLDGIEGLCALCQVKLKISKGEAPDEQVLRDLMKTESGPAFLDQFVKTLDPRINREALINVTKARFDLTEVAFHADYENNAPSGTAEGGTAVPAVDLRAMYDILAKVPPAYTRDNPSLKELRKFDKEDSSFFDSSAKGMAMFCGRAHDDSKFALGAAWEIDRSLDTSGATLDHIDTSTPAPDFFSWQVWHELAHSIDDKVGFMESKQAGSKYGGWQVHGGNTAPVVDAVATKFGCTSAEAKTYIEHVIAGKTPAAPAEDKMTPAQRTDVNAWYEAVKTSSNVWDDGGATARNALGDRMYQEAYDNTWVSYELKQRASGVTGYQFRAPGEWFSELYAALKTGKLKTSHPVYDELNQY